MTQALIVVDIQNDYFPGGAMELVGSEEAAHVAASIKSDFKAKALPVIMVQHIAKSPTATFFLPGTNGAEIHDSVALQPDDFLVVKNFPNSFRETNLLEILQEKSITDLAIVGMMTHMCIDTTVRAANDLGFKVTVYGNACATRGLTFERTVAAADVQTAYLAALDGSFAEVKNWEN
jgi:nicotinamidase-related amidase